MDGILIIDKPAGLTSHDVVARVRRIMKTKRVGHTGTLDPFATGVMVILVGKATRLAQFLDKDEKEYEAVVRFGFETDTGDRTGTKRAGDAPVGGKDVTVEEVMQVLPLFTGVIEQTPPMYSAKKIAGKKLYELARQGIEVERRCVTITISKLEVYELSDPGGSPADLGLRVTCSAGTYIRTLAEDIGRAVGTGAHLAELRRTRAGKFSLGDDVTMEELQNQDDPKLCLIPMSEAISHIPSVALNAERVGKTLNGLSTRILDLPFRSGEAVRMLDEQGEIVAIGYYNEAEKTVQPKIVLS